MGLLVSFFQAMNVVRVRDVQTGAVELRIFYKNTSIVFSASATMSTGFFRPGTTVGPPNGTYTTTRRIVIGSCAIWYGTTIGGSPNSGLNVTVIQHVNAVDMVRERTKGAAFTRTADLGKSGLMSNATLAMDFVDAGRRLSHCRA